MKYLLKFNNKERLKDIQNGSLWFYPNFKFRDIELKEGIIGQGDKMMLKLFCKVLQDLKQKIMQIPLKIQSLL